MKNSDKKLIVLALALFVVVLIVRVVPVITGSYQLKKDDLVRLEIRIERLQTLQENQPALEQREVNKDIEIAELRAWTFSGNTANLVGSNVQQELRQAVSAANVNVREMRVAEYARIDEWLVVSQEMTFTIEQGDMIRFLNLLAQSSPKLHVTEFSIDRTRRQFSGSLTVTAFSRAAEMPGQDLL